MLFLSILGVVFPSLTFRAQADKYQRLLQNHLSLELMQIVTIPTKDRNQMLVGVGGFLVQWEKGFRPSHVLQPH